MIFQMHNSDFGWNYNTVKYDFDDVDSVTVEDPEMNKLIRGANAKNKTGLAYKEGVREPKKVTVVLLGISPELFDLFGTAYDLQTRSECFAVDRLTGSSMIAKQAVISQRPRQLSIAEGSESMNVSVVFETFDLDTVYKEA